MADNTSTCSCGFGVGNVIAAILSWVTWHSVGWCIVNCLFGWLYVIYWALKYWK